MEGDHESIQADHRRVSWDILAGVWRLRQRSAGRGFSPIRDWILRRRLGIWTHRAHNGLRHRAHFGLPSESSSLIWACGRQTVPCCRIVTLRRRAGHRGNHRSRSAIRDRQRKGGIRRERGFRVERLRCALSGRIFLGGMLCRGSGADLLLPAGHYGSNGPARSTPRSSVSSRRNTTVRIRPSARTSATS